VSKDKSNVEENGPDSLTAPKLGSKGGRNSNKNRNKKPPPLPKNFEQSPLFDNDATQKYFRLQPQSRSQQKDMQQIMFDRTIKVGSEQLVNSNKMRI